MFLLADIDHDTVDFQPNYDESEQRAAGAAGQPIPNLLINGADGIAVGMATNIPPHNPGEIIDATLALIADPDITLDELMKIVPGPGFPDRRDDPRPRRHPLGVRDRPRLASSSARSAEFEEIREDRKAIIVTEIPYQVNKATLLERIAELVRAKQVEGISDMRDESDRDGMRIVIELKRDATAEVVLNQLYRFTQLQTSFGINMLALDDGRPRLMGLKDALQCFIAFREEVILRRAPVRSRQGARARASAGRPGDRGRQYRRGDPR